MRRRSHHRRPQLARTDRHRPDTRPTNPTGRRTLRSGWRDSRPCRPNRNRSWRRSMVAAATISCAIRTARRSSWEEAGATTSRAVPRRRSTRAAGATTRSRSGQDRTWWHSIAVTDATQSLPAVATARCRSVPGFATKTSSSDATVRASCLERALARASR